MTAEPPRISVLLPTFRQPEILLLTLRDLQAQDYPDDAWELVILDDASRDASAQVALATLPNRLAVTMRRRTNGGAYSHAALFNEMLRLADPGSEVFIHVEDVRLRSDFLSQHAKWHTRSEPVLVNGPMCEAPTETFAPDACSRWALMEMSGVRCAAYRCCFQAIFAKGMSYSRGLKDALDEPSGRGPFDDGMTGWGYHEVEFAFRAQNAGALCIYDVSCGVYHPPHNARDEAGYRKLKSEALRADGSARNIDYMCRKHGLSELPEWEVGIPIEVPQPMWRCGDGAKESA